jgi:hypothetical protein
MLRRNNNLINARGINNNPPINSNSPSIQEDFINFLAALLAIQPGVNANQRKLPPNPAFEMHPYLQYVSQEYLEKYIIGTFPPISYVIDLLLSEYSLEISHLLQPIAGRRIKKPDIPFFHGNRRLMWDYILTQEELEELSLKENRENKKEFLIKWLQENGIIYSDIIFSIQRKLEDGRYSAKDTQLYNICINKNLISHILFNPNVKYLMFNSGSTFGQNNWVNMENPKSFDLFIRGCLEVGLKVELRINQGPTHHFNWIEINVANAAIINQYFRNKIAFEIKLTISKNTNKAFLSNCLNSESFFSKEFHVVTPVSPAGIRGATLGNLIFQRWAIIHNGGIINMAGLGEFLKDIFTWYKQGNFDQIYNLNVNNI